MWCFIWEPNHKLRKSDSVVRTPRSNALFLEYNILSYYDVLKGSLQD